MTFSFQDKPNMLAKLQEAYNLAEASTATTGRYAQVYDLLFMMISVDSTGQPLITETSVLSIDLNTFDLSYDEKFNSGWQPSPDIGTSEEEGAWVHHPFAA